MTIINVVKNNNISRIEVKGHSNYADLGKDIVCAAISSIVITSVNAIKRIDDQAIDYQVKDGYIKVNVLNHSDVIDILLTNMLAELESLEKKYKKNVKINM